jgi:hypothetical protein
MVPDMKSRTGDASVRMEETEKKDGTTISRILKLSLSQKHLPLSNV